MSGGSEKEIKQMKIDELKLKFTKENSDRLFKEMSLSQQCVDFEFQKEEIETDQDGRSLWGLFLDAIQQNPKMVEMKSVIEQAKKNKSNIADFNQNKILESYYNQLN